MSDQPSPENCECGQYHLPNQDEQDEIQEDTTSMEEKLEALENLSPEKKISALDCGLPYEFLHQIKDCNHCDMRDKFGNSKSVFEKKLYRNRN